MIRRPLFPLGLVCLSACSVSPEPVAPVLETQATFENALGTADRPVREDWYLAFDDPVLSDLVAAALLNNLELSAALANLDASKANARAAGADLLPT